MAIDDRIWLGGVTWSLSLPDLCGRGASVAKKKKVRVAFNKNRQKRTRINDLTRGYTKEGADNDQAVSAERVRAKGDLSRHRTVMQEVPEARR